MCHFSSAESPLKKKMRYKHFILALVPPLCYNFIALPHLLIFNYHGHSHTQNGFDTLHLLRTFNVKLSQSWPSE